MYKLDLEKAQEPEIKLPTYIGSQRKQGSSRKTSTSASLTTLNPLTCVDHNKLDNSQTGIPDHLTCLLRNLYVGQETTMEQPIDSKLRKEYDKAVYCCSVYLTSMQSTSCKMLGWMKLMLESRLPGERSITSDIIPQ